MIGHGLSSRHHAGLAALALLWCSWAAPPPLAAATLQAEAPDRDLLRERVRLRFEVVPLRDGVLLIPKRDRGNVKFIEIVGGTISINGQVVTGGELQDRLRDDAPLVLQLSYLARRDLLAVSEPAPSQPPRAIERPELELPESPALPDSRAGRRSRDVVRIGGNVTVRPDETVLGDVVVIAGSGEVDGVVTGDVVVIAGSLRLGVKSEVRGDVVVVASLLDRAPGAIVSGELVDVGFGNLRMRIGELDFPNPFLGRFRTFPRFLGLFATLLRLGLLVMFGWLFVAVARRPVQRIAERAAAQPVKAGLVGVLIELLFFPMLILVSVLLAVSVVGIPLLALVPVAVLLMAIVLITGFTAMALRVGQWAGMRLGADRLEPYSAVALGTVVLLSLALLGRLAFLAGGPSVVFGVALTVFAFCIEYVAWTIGLGAAVLVRLAPRSQPAVTTTGTLGAAAE